MTSLLPNPFQNSGVIVLETPDDAAASSSPLPHDAAAALSDGWSFSSLPSGESEPSVMLAYPSSGTEVAGSVRTAASDEIQSLGVVVDRGTAQRLEIEPRNAGFFSGPTASGAVWHGENGCSDPATPCDLTRPSQFNAAADIDRLANYFRRATRRFVPDKVAIWDAMHDPNAPRAVLDPIWADEPPLFLQAIG